MASSTLKTAITVRVQARGGKFLGDDVGGATVTLRDAQTGIVLASGPVGGDSGNLEPAYSATASQLVIATPGTSPNATPTVQWLVPDAGTSAFRTSLAIERPTLIEISAFGPLGGLQSQQRVTTTQWIVPGENVDQGPGFVVELPGLVVQVLAPATHQSLASLPSTVTISVNVTMMCGCPIAAGKPWIPDDFDVQATIRVVGGEALEQVVLAFQAPGPSLFTGTYEVTAAGYYEAQIHAIQKSTGNTGVGVVTFFYTPPS